MAQQTNLHALTLAGMDKCLQRLGRSSAGNWRLAGVEVTKGTLAHALAPYDGVQTAAVYMAMNELPLTGVMAANPADIEDISKAFTGHSFPRGSHITAAEEVMLTELGNILINVLVNIIINALKRSMLPALPLFVTGDAAALAGAIGAPAAPCRLIEARVELTCGGPASELHLFALLPEPIAATLD